MKFTFSHSISFWIVVGLSFTTVISPDHPITNCPMNNHGAFMRTLTSSAAGIIGITAASLPVLRTATSVLWTGRDRQTQRVADLS